MTSLMQRIENNAAVVAGAIIAVLNLVAVAGVWNPKGTTLAAINAAVAAVLALFVQSVPSLQARRVRREYLAEMRRDARQVVATAGSIIGEVIGRDDVCDVIIENFHDRRIRRPQVIVSDAETGKTAVLVRLTESMANKNLVPIPLRMCDVFRGLDFENLAREQFLNSVNEQLLSSDNGDIIWRQLRKSDKIVVLADGLEEALAGTAAEPERDNVIREAIRRANEHQLPLIITSRSYDLLRATEAAIVVLEPLSSEAALAYVLGVGTGDEERRFAWIVETADVMEAPLFLQITRELFARGLLDGLSRGRRMDARTISRLTLRLTLLEAWNRAMISGYVREDVPLNKSERRMTVEHISALACVGLKRAGLEVEFDELRSADSSSAEVQSRLAEIINSAPYASGVRNVDLRLAAAWAAQLDLVEIRGDRVRFPHSLMQAYFGSRLLEVALQDPAYLQEALHPPGPSQEFLSALVMCSLAPYLDVSRADSVGVEAANSERQPGDPSPAHAHDSPEKFLAPLRHAAAKRDDNKVLDIYAAAMEIDSHTAVPAHCAIAEEIKDRWARIYAQDPRTLEEGKLALVRRFGESARTIDGRRRRGEETAGEPAYLQLYAIGCGERSYRVQLAVAQEIGAGGDAAYQTLSEELGPPCQTCPTQRISDQATEPKPSPCGHAGDDDSRQMPIMAAWLAPMLTGSVGAAFEQFSLTIVEQAQGNLAHWVRHVRPHHRRPGEEDLPIMLEIALAQGFKYAANRGPTNPHTRMNAREWLAEQALEMLQNTGFWFSQLTLIQALCLLNLPGEPWQSGDRRGATPEAIVQRWLDVAGSESAIGSLQPGGSVRLHPFVREAAQLAVLALKTGLPQRYCWIDENAVVGQVGSRNTSTVTATRRHSLWIPPSSGWTALDGRAQQLVADVVLLLNLMDRGDQQRDRERLLKRTNRPDLPPCITRFRASLNPGLTVGTATSSAPGTNCVDGCAFGLCPYPPKGVQPMVEMSEAFCRRQQALLTRHPPSRRRAPWQEMSRARLVRFWEDMTGRARGPNPIQRRPI